MTLSTDALTAFANANANASALALANGTLELLSSTGSALANVGLGTPSAAGSVTTMSGFPKTVLGSAGTVTSARYKTSAGAAWKSNMTVGLSSTAAPAWAQGTTYNVDAKCTVGANQYIAVSGGTSAVSGSGPTGTGSGITDGSVTWNYLCPANAQVQMSSLTISAGQQVLISNATLAHSVQ